MNFLQKMLGMLDRFKIEVFIASAITGQVNVWIGYFTAWGKLDWLFPAAAQSWIATGVTGIVSSILGAVGMLVLVRVYRILVHLDRLAKDAESEIRGVVVDASAAKALPELKNVVGPGAQAAAL